MTFTIALRMACIALITSALAATAAAAEQHNFILLMPEAMQSANVNDADTPALARLREEGVFYSRSFSGFPDFTFASREKSAASRAAGLVAFSRDRYATLVVEDYPPSEESIEQALSRVTQEKRPFILVYRLRALDTLAAAPAKSLVSAHPGGEGAAGVLLLNTDRALSIVERKLQERGLFENTNIVVVAEHGRSTVWKQSRTSYTGEMSFSGVPSGNLPPGFVAIDLIKAMLHEDGGLSLYDPQQNHETVHWWEGRYPSSGLAVIAVSRLRPQVTIEARGGYDLMYMPERLDKRELARRGRFIVERLFLQDYVSGVFVNEERIGRVDGALSLKYLGATAGDYDEQLPDIVVSFVSSVMRCGHPTICAVSIADTPVQEGQDMAVGFSRAETSTFMAARGPDFREEFSSRTPASPADMIRTIGNLVGLRPNADEKKEARELTETLRGSERKPEPKVRTQVVSSKASEAGDFVEVHLLSVNGFDYLEAAGAPGRSVGVPAREAPIDWHWEWPWKTFEISIKP
jgi:hypothetical protein